MMKFLLSGGWGYGNLGDDAIMIASIHLLHKEFPMSFVSLITNMPEEACPVLINEPNIKVIESIYRKLYPDYRLKNHFKGFSVDVLFEKIKNKLASGKHKKKVDKFLSSPTEFIKQNYAIIKPFEEVCKSADIYVMSGGGYLNNWTEMAIVKYIEAYIANKNGLKCYMIGQTIGPFFHQYSFKLTKSVCSFMNNICYRDIESIKDTAAMDISCVQEAIPDLALSEEFDFLRKNQITIVPFKNNAIQNANVLVNNIKEIVNRLDKCKVVVTVSQLWYGPINLAVFIYSLLISNNIIAELVIPKNIIELQKILGESKLVISQNLHGLILAYRSHVPIVSLNAGRKFVSFMKMINASDLIIEPEQIKDLELSHLCLDALQRTEENKIKLFNEKITSTIKEMLN